MNELEESLLAYFRRLSQSDAHALLRFAAYLASERGEDNTGVVPSPLAPASAAPAALQRPQLAPRPDNERVVDALKRLSNAYPMLEKKKLLDKASTMVAQHIMFGKPAKTVIDELEKLFADAYAEYARTLEGN